MKQVDLGRGRVALVSDQDHTLVAQYKWHARQDKRRVNAFYAYATGHSSLMMHRLIMGFPKSDVDHRNWNGLDNRRSNLRLASKHSNGANRGKNRNNTSGFKGVAWSNQANKWQAQIRVKGHQYHLGLFHRKEEAAVMYGLASIFYFGEFAHQ